MQKVRATRTTARVTDEYGAVADQLITVTVDGTNDSPVITSDAAAAIGSVVEAGQFDDGTDDLGIVNVSGTLISSDVDVHSTATWSLDGDGSDRRIHFDRFSHRRLDLHAQ